MASTRIAIPVWGARISPVFDTARRLLLVDVTSGREAARSEAEISEQAPTLRAARLRELAVNVLLCGAISRPLASMVGASGLTVLPFLAGGVDDVLAAYLAGRLPAPEFLMPGCCRTRQGRHGRRARRGRGSSST